MNLTTSQHTTANGVPYTGKSYWRPGFSASAVVGDIESFMIQADDLMTFYPSEVREMAAALNALADAMESE